MTELAVMTAFQTAVAATSGIQSSRVEIDGRRAARLNVDHVSIRPVLRRRMGRAFEDGEGWSQHRRLRVQVTAAGGSAADGILDTHALFQVPTDAMVALMEAGVGVVEVGDIFELTRQMARSWERVSVFDVTLSYVHTIEASQPAPADRVTVTVEAVGDLEDGPVEVVDDLADHSHLGFVHLLLPEPVIP